MKMKELAGEYYQSNKRGIIKNLIIFGVILVLLLGALAWGVSLGKGADKDNTETEAAAVAANYEDEAMRYPYEIAEPTDTPTTNND